MISVPSVHHEVLSSAVLCSKCFPIWSGIRESYFVSGNYVARYKVQPVVMEKIVSIVSFSLSFCTVFSRVGLH